MYNGHKNWNHWNVSLWLSNVDYNYRQVNEVLRYHTKDESAEILSHILKGYLYGIQSRLYKLSQPGLDILGNPVEEQTTPDGARWTKTAIRAALVGWELDTSCLRGGWLTHA